MVIHSELLSDPVGFMGTLLGNSMSIEHDSVMSISLYYLAPLTVIISIMVFVWFSLPSISDLRTRSYCRCTAASTEFNSRVIPLLEKIPYNVPFWYNKHLGATIPFGYHPNLKFDREIYGHDCGSKFAADWYPSRPNTNTTKICVFVPGLGSNTDHKYVQQFVRHMSSQGYTCVVVTARGVGMPLTTAHVWHPGLTDDVYKVLMAECPMHVPLFFVAFSAGTNILRHTLMRLHDEGRLIESASRPAPRTLRSGRKYGDSRTPGGCAQPVSKKFMVKGSMSVCIAGEDYVQARTYLEQHHECECETDLDTTAEQKLVRARAATDPSAVGSSAGAGGLWGLCLRGLNSLEGLVYSLLMTKLYKSIILSNPHVLHLFDDDLVQDMHSCSFMSELDTKCNWRLFNFESEQHMIDTFSVNRREIREKVGLPMLLVQPLDDPLHKSNPYYSIDRGIYTENPNIIYAEIDHGNHFGFYEGNNLLNIFQNQRCYTYPPKLATVFFQSIMDKEKHD